MKVFTEEVGCDLNLLSTKKSISSGTQNISLLSGQLERINKAFNFVAELKKTQISDNKTVDEAELNEQLFSKDVVEDLESALKMSFKEAKGHISFVYVLRRNC